MTTSAFPAEFSVVVKRTFLDFEATDDLLSCPSRDRATSDSWVACGERWFPDVRKCKIVEEDLLSCATTQPDDSSFSLDSFSPCASRATPVVPDGEFDSGMYVGPPPGIWAVGVPDFTTVQVQGIREGMCRQEFVNVLNTSGFVGQYDFVYVPMDYRSGKNLGTATINFITPAVAREAHTYFNDGQSLCAATWAEQQGFIASVGRFRNNPVMHDRVPDEYKPIIFYSGVRVVFPEPTRKIRPPGVFRQ